MPGKLPELIDFSQARIRTLHFTWVAFFISFYLWFNMAPLATTMLRELGGADGWLTDQHLQLLAICNVALTIPARIAIGALIDRIGPRRCFSGLLIIMAVPTLAFAWGNSLLQLVVARLVLSTIGASFVIGIRMVAQWFPPAMMGRAEGLYAGWGNFGSAFAAMTLPWLALEVLGEPNGWRWALTLNALAAVAYGVIYLLLVRDTPEGVRFRGVARVQPLLVSSRADLLQYCAWSAPLVGGLGLLAWRARSLGRSPDGDAIVSDSMFWSLLAGLGLLFVVHVIKTLQVNLPHLRRGVPPEEQYRFADVAALNTTYFANFGAELAVVSMLPAFFEATFSLSPTVAGVLASSFAAVNLLARPLGGLISDSLRNRKRVMLVYMAGIASGFLGMAMIDGTWPVWAAVTLTVVCSVFVQGAEGATFAMLPMINRRMTGQIAGMAGAYGNVGAVVYLVVLSFVTPTTFFLVLAAGAGLSLAFCATFLREPAGSFAQELSPPTPLGATR